MIDAQQRYHHILLQQFARLLRRFFVKAPLKLNKDGRSSIYGKT